MYEQKNEVVDGRNSRSLNGRLYERKCLCLEEKDVIGTWYVNELSMGEGASFHPGAMGMEVTVDIKEDGKMEQQVLFMGKSLK